MNDNPLLTTLSPNLIADIQTYPISVLLIDDQMIIAEAVKRMLSGQSDIIFHYCSDPAQAIAMASKVNPTVILQDLVMPEFDGLTLVKYFRVKPSTREIPIIVLTTKEDPQIKAEAFALGANDYIVKLPDKLELIARIRYHSNSYIRLLERNEAFDKLKESQRVLQNELAEAAAYVISLLPLPLEGTVKSDWRFIPSTQLGGDAFGYHWLDDRYFAVYLLDVCGHGVGSALHSISIVNVLRSQNLPKADFHDPKSVLIALNEAFQMEDHNNLFFTIWYGVYDMKKREITYASGGHPPAVLITGESEEKAKIYQLATPGIVIGAFPVAEFQNGVCQVEKYNRLFIFSDGVYEMTRSDGSMLQFEQFIRFLPTLSKSEGSELDDLIQKCQNIQGKPLFPDDFSILELSFGE